MDLDRTGTPVPTAALQTYPAAVGSQHLDLPIVPLSDDLAIALLMTIDCGVSFAERAGTELAERLAPAGVEIVATAATLGIPVAIEVTRALGLDDYLVLQKSPKIHLRDALGEAVVSVTSTGNQRLLLDRRRCSAVAGRRTAFVDDVISTGASVVAALSLLRQAGAVVVAIGALLSEGTAWRQALGADAGMVQALGSIPTFEPAPAGWSPKG